MVFCREMHMTYTEYRAQPARVILRWQEYLRVEGEVAAFNRKVEESRAKARAR